MLGGYPRVATARWMTSRMASCLSLRLLRRRVAGFASAVPASDRPASGVMGSSIGCPPRSNVGGAWLSHPQTLETVSVSSRVDKHLFECVAHEIAHSFEYSLDSNIVRMYVRNRASHPPL